MEPQSAAFFHLTPATPAKEPAPPELVMPLGQARFTSPSASTCLPQSLLDFALGRR